MGRQFSKRRLKRRKKDHLSKHHIVNKCRGGEDVQSNLLRMWFTARHQPWHKLFGDRDLEETIEFLQRVKRAVNHRNLKLL